LGPLSRAAHADELTSDWSNHALLLVAYIYGFLLAGTPWLGRAFDRQWRRMAAIALTGSAALMLGTWYGILPGRLPPPYSALYLGFWTLYAVCAWAWMVALLGVARRWMNRGSALVRYGRRTGYAMYLVHQPVIVVLAYLLVQTTLPVAAKFWLLIAAAGAMTLCCAELLIRLPIIRLMVATQSRQARRSS
jgi:glucan biosynthesis protein C